MMKVKGRHNGRQLKAQELKQLYTEGERDFRGTILRGCNFSNTDLSGADFSEADICGAKFVDAKLHQAIFSYAKAGVQKRWRLGQIGLLLILAALVGLLQGGISALVNLVFSYDSGLVFRGGGIVSVSAIIAGILMILIVFFAIARQGFTVRTLGSVILIGAAVGTAVGTGLVVGITASPSIYFVTFALVFGIAFTVTGAFYVFFGGGATVLDTTASLVAGGSVGGLVGATAGVIASMLLFIYINQRSNPIESGFKSLRVVSLALTTLGGTCFSGADLTGAYFSHAILKGADFTDSRHGVTQLNNVRWHHAQKLDQARLGNTYLRDPRVCQLLVTLDGIDQDFTQANLSGANLAGTKFHRSNLHRVNLSGATLQMAEFQGANFTEANCVNADFTNAQLTGACLDAWNIDGRTVLKNIDCQYVFLRSQPDEHGNQERRPHDPRKSFQPGDFETFFGEMLSLVQLLIKNSVNPEAFKAAFQKLTETYPEITLEAIQGLECHGTDIKITILTPKNLDKGMIEQIWNNAYRSQKQENGSFSFSQLLSSVIYSD